jgi:hypothetical protein
MLESLRLAMISLFIFCAATSIVAIDIKSKLKFNFVLKIFKLGKKKTGERARMARL